MVGLTIEDRVEIHELIARYNWATDTGDAKARAETFTPDGVFEGWIGRFEGRDEIERSHARPPTEVDSKWSGHRGRLQHWVNNIVLYGDGERATGAAYFLLLIPSQTAGEIVGGGQYQDVLVKTDGKWLFKERHVMDWPSPQS